MPDETAPEAPKYKPLRFTGDVAAGKYLLGIAASDHSAEQAEKWLGPQKYALALGSGYYEEVDTEAREPAPPAPRRRSRRKE